MGYWQGTLFYWLVVLSIQGSYTWCQVCEGLEWCIYVLLTVIATAFVSSYVTPMYLWQFLYCADRLLCGRKPYVSLYTPNDTTCEGAIVHTVDFSSDNYPDPKELKVIDVHTIPSTQANKTIKLSYWPIQRGKVKHQFEGRHECWWKYYVSLHVAKIYPDHINLAGHPSGFELVNTCQTAYNSTSSHQYGALCSPVAWVHAHIVLHMPNMW